MPLKRVGLLLLFSVPFFGLVLYYNPLPVSSQGWEHLFSQTGICDDVGGYPDPSEYGWEGWRAVDIINWLHPAFDDGVGCSVEVSRSYDFTERFAVSPAFQLVQAREIGLQFSTILIERGPHQPLEPACLSWELYRIGPILFSLVNGLVCFDTDNPPYPVSETVFVIPWELISDHSPGDYYQFRFYDAGIADTFYIDDVFVAQIDTPLPTATVSPTPTVTGTPQQCIVLDGGDYSTYLDPGGPNCGASIYRNVRMLPDWDSTDSDNAGYHYYWCDTESLTPGIFLTETEVEHFSSLGLEYTRYINSTPDAVATFPADIPAAEVWGFDSITKTEVMTVSICGVHYLTPTPTATITPTLTPTPDSSYTPTPTGTAITGTATITIPTPIPTGTPLTPSPTLIAVTNTPGAGTPSATASATVTPDAGGIFPATPVGLPDPSDEVVDIAYTPLEVCSPPWLVEVPGIIDLGVICYSFQPMAFIGFGEWEFQIDYYYVNEIILLGVDIWAYMVSFFSIITLLVVITLIRRR